MDGVINYRFREAILRFFAGGQGAATYVPITASHMFDQLLSVLEDYPRPAIYSSMNIVDSHDVDRILYDLSGNKAKLREVATLQMTWSGAPTIYYGDEAGLTGGIDPDDRRTFPWGSEDTGLQAYYRKLIALRKAHSALRDGSVQPLVLDDAHRIVGYLRRDSKESVAVLLTDGKPVRTVAVQIPGVSNGAHLTDAISGRRYTVTGGRVTVKLQGLSAAVLTVS
jgi:glycosidase